MFSAALVCCCYWTFWIRHPDLCLTLPHHLPAHSGSVPSRRKIKAGMPNSLKQNKALTARQNASIWSIATVAWKGQMGLFINTKVNLLMDLNFASWSASNILLVLCVWGAVWNSTVWLFCVDLLGHNKEENMLFMLFLYKKM